MDERAVLPPRARLLIPGAIVAGALCLAFGAVEVVSWARADGVAFLLLTTAVAVGEGFPLPFRHRTEILYLSLSDAVWTAALVLLLAGGGAGGGHGRSVLILGVAAGALIGQGVRGRPPVKLAFNVAQFLVGITVAQGVFSSLGPGAIDAPGTWAETGVAMAAFLLINVGLTNLVIALVEQRPFVSILRSSFGPVVLHWTGNVALGLVAAVTWHEARPAVPLLVAPLVLSYFAYQAWLQGKKERDRLRGLYEAGQALLVPLDQVDFGPFLANLQRLLAADHAEIVLVEGDRVVIRGVDGTVALERSSEGTAQPGPDAFVRIRGGLPPHVAPVQGGRMTGLLAVYRTGSLTLSERSLLDSLASQVGSRLLNQDLYSETVRQQTELADIIRNTTDGIFTLSDDGHILTWNPAMERIMDLPARVALGRRWRELVPQEAEQPIPSGDHVSRANVLFESRGVERWIECTYGPIEDGTGNVTGQVVVIRDVTREREAEQLKEEFIATVSHELRTPLTPLKGFLSTLMTGTGEDSPEVRREYYAVMRRQTMRLERLITDLLDVSGMEFGGLQVDNRVLDLDPLLLEQVEDFRGQHPERQIEYRCLRRPVFVHGDPLRISQVVANLLTNAVKYSPRGTGIAITLEQTDSEGVVSVRDEGVGIAQADQERIFDRFYRVERGLTRRSGGTGLGLYIARQLSDAMSGRISVESTPGEGSTFEFALPLAEAHVLGSAPGQPVSAPRPV